MPVELFTIREQVITYLGKELQNWIEEICMIFSPVDGGVAAGGDSASNLKQEVDEVSRILVFILIDSDNPAS